MRLLVKTVAAKFITQTVRLMLQAAVDVLKSAVGLNAGFANHRFGLEVSRADGKNFDKPYAIQAVYRYQW